MTRLENLFGCSCGCVFEIGFGGACVRRAGIVSQHSTVWCSGRKRPGKSCAAELVRGQGGTVWGRSRTLMLGQALRIE